MNKIKNKNKQTGFTLIEVMVAVAVVGILTAIAYPSYKRSVQKTKRADCKVTISSLVSEIEKQKIAYKRYSAIPNDKLGLDSSSKTYCGKENEKTYEIELKDKASSDNNWSITATPKTSMKDTGILKINQKGHSCWSNTAADCTLSSTSSWDE